MALDALYVLSLDSRGERFAGRGCGRTVGGHRGREAVSVVDLRAFRDGGEESRLDPGLETVPSDVRNLQRRRRTEPDARPGEESKARGIRALRAAVEEKL